MEKNVTVIDEQGHEYGATYPKRAKGLVKNGRARFVDENTICLACPPNEILEDIKMSENMNIGMLQKTNEITVEVVLSQITKLQEQLVSLKEMNDTLFLIDDAEEFENGEPTKVVNADVALAKIEAVKSAYEEREKTLNSLLDFYKSIYNDLQQEKKKAEPMSEEERRAQFLNFVHKTTVGASAGSLLPNFEKIWKTVYLGQ